MSDHIREAFFAKYGEECLDDQALADFTAGWHAGRDNLLSPFSWLSTLEKADADKARIAALEAALRSLIAVTADGNTSRVVGMMLDNARALLERKP